MKQRNILSVSAFMILICFSLFAGCSPPGSADEVPISIDISDSKYEPMNDYIERLPEAFSESPHVAQSRKSVNELFPATEIPADELSWFLECDDDVTVKAIKGIRFNNDDILIVFFYSTEISDETVLEHAAININMHGSPLIPPPNVYEYNSSSAFNNGFGVIAYSFSKIDMEQIIANIARDAREY